MDEILNNNKNKKDVFSKTIDEICCKATKYGDFEDYCVLADILKILDYCKNTVNEK